MTPKKDIKPRVDDEFPDRIFVDVDPDGDQQWSDSPENVFRPVEYVSAHAVRRMSVELEAWRSGRLGRVYNAEHNTHQFAVCFPAEYKTEWKYFDTIEAATDALMEEE